MSSLWFTFHMTGRTLEDMVANGLTEDELETIDNDPTEEEDEL